MFFNPELTFKCLMQNFYFQANCNNQNLLTQLSFLSNHSTQIYQSLVTTRPMTDNLIGDNKYHR